jgi:hypothetical protein
MGIELTYATQTNGPVRSNPGGLGGLRNPELCGTGPEATIDIVTMSMTETCPNLGSIMISLTNP